MVPYASYIPKEIRKGEKIWQIMRDELAYMGL